MKTPERDENKVFCCQWAVSLQSNPIKEAMSEFKLASDDDRKSKSSLDSIFQPAEDFVAGLVYLQFGWLMKNQLY